MNDQSTIRTKERVAPTKKTSNKKLPTGEVGKANLSNVKVPRRVDVEGSDRGLDLSTFQGRLTYCRLQAGLSEGVLGETLGYSRQAINAYETGKSMPNLKQMQMLAERMGVPASYLAFGERVINGKAIKTGHNDPVANVAQYIWSAGRFLKESSFVLPKDFAKSLAGASGYTNLGVYRIDFDATHFGVAKGDRAVIDKKTDRLSNEWKRWLVIIDKNPQLVSYQPSPGTGLSLVMGDGSTISIASKDVTVVGPVVGTICAG